MVSEQFRYCCICAYARLPTDDENNTPFSIERYLGKILKTYDQTTKLVDFALSSRHGRIFQNQPELVFVHSQARHVELNIQGAINTVQRQMTTTREDKVYLNRLKGQKLEERYICCPHCECAMLENILRRWKFHQRPEPIIGISTLSCFGCRLYILAYSYARLRLTVSCPFLSYNLLKRHYATREPTCLCVSLSLEHATQHTCRGFPQI
ncbi:hypothetical protein IW262DRAFT_693166 [Armillaria fumosa]|nr:hypothetical protein IW262DRAFT_693166 [Armillaria fumosa]